MESGNSKLYEKQEELHVMVATLAVKVDQGFKGVHKRQDITNGRIGQVETDMEELEDVAKKNSNRLDTVDAIHSKKEEGRKWLKREFISTFLSILSVVLTAAILLLIGLK